MYVYICVYIHTHIYIYITLQRSTPFLVAALEPVLAPACAVRPLAPGEALGQRAQRLSPPTGACSR